ncbi:MULTISPECIES: ABC transporter ATP-binding protein [Rhizobium/Agrobacterium group]|uniref:ABC transporter ATP-binding protein n=1 Tax=Rhizobium/Agrobacterium group TaxID=227290 RepID=UPI00046FFF5C|nr:MULTISPECIES: ABC transporter ATP-binding protein [unclassified Rhizobium]
MGIRADFNLWAIITSDICVTIIDLYHERSCDLNENLLFFKPPFADAEGFEKAARPSSALTRVFRQVAATLRAAVPAKSKQQGNEGIAMQSGIAVTLNNVSIQIGDFEIASNINLSIEPGEFLCLLGPSGCGKSTLLNAIAGFASVAGDVLVGRTSVTRPGTDRGVVFQSSEALFPWLTVRENVEYGARIRGIDKAKRSEIADEYIKMVGLSHAADKYPGELSGGMRQRTQIARVLANEPSVILMDEPFGALDAQTREVLQGELAKISRKTGATIVFVTHDISEAIILADKIVTMTAGPSAKIKTVMEVDLPTPRDLDHPRAVELMRVLRNDIAVEVNRTLIAQGLISEGQAV